MCQERAKHIEAGAHLVKLLEWHFGRDYVQNYGQVGGVNPTYWSNLQAKSNFDYEAIAKALLDTQNDGSTFGKNEAYLRQVGLGYAPKGLPKGVTKPTTGIPR